VSTLRSAGKLPMPISWYLASIDDVSLKISNGLTSKQVKKSSGVPVTRIETISTGAIDLSKVGYLEDVSIADIKKWRLCYGDILFSHINSDQHLGKTALFKMESFNLLHGMNLLVLRPNDSVVVPDFLNYWLTWLRFCGYFQSIAQHAVNQSSINIAKLRQVELPLPPLAEQTRIVEKLEELLSDLDAGVAELKAAQKKLAQYRQSLLKAAVEGALTADWRAAQASANASQGSTSKAPKPNHPTETGAQLLQRILTERRARWEVKQLAKFKEQGKAPPKDWKQKYPEPVQPDTTDLLALPEGWVWASVDQLSEFVRNGLSRTPNTEGCGFPIFKINAVRPMAVNFTAIKHIELDESEAKDYWVEVGDVLATRYNGSVDLLGVFGMVKAVPQRTLHPDKLIRMKPLLGVRLGAWMEVCGNIGESRSHLVSRVKTTAGQTGISGEDLKKTPIPLPPLPEQEAALESLERSLHFAGELEVPTELSLKQSIAQRQNILRAAFSGQLVPQDPNDEPASVLLERIRAERASQIAEAKPRGRKTKSHAA
jgi:type I restriction enzyme, S subunit